MVISELSIKVSADTSGFTAAMRAVRTETQAAGQSAQAAGTAVEGATKKMTDGANSVASAFAKLQSLSAMRQVGREMADAGDSILGAIAKSVQFAGNFETALNVFQSTAHATGAEMATVSAKAIQLGNDMTLPATSAKTAVDAMLAMSQAGLRLPDVMSGVRGALMAAAAGGIKAGDAGRYMATTLKAFQLEGSQAGRVADMFAALLPAAGAKMNAVAAAVQYGGQQFASAKVPLSTFLTEVGILAQAGFQGSRAGSALGQMMKNLQSPTVQASAAMKQLHLSFYDANGVMKPQRQIIEELNAALSKLSPKQQDEFKNIVFSTNARRAANILLKAGTEGYDKMHAALTKQGEAENQSKARMKGFQGAMEALNNQIETLQISLGQKLIPTITSLLREISKLVEEFNKLPEGTQKFIVWGAAIGGVFLAVGGRVLAFIAQIKAIQLQWMISRNQMLANPMPAPVPGGAAGAAGAAGGIRGFLAGGAAGVSPLALLAPHGPANPLADAAFALGRRLGILPEEARSGVAPAGAGLGQHMYAGYKPPVSPAKATQDAVLKAAGGSYIGESPTDPVRDIIKRGQAEAKAAAAEAKRLQKEQQRDAEQAAKEKLRANKEVSDEIFRLTHSELETKRRQFREEEAENIKAGVSKTLAHQRYVLSVQEVEKQAQEKITEIHKRENDKRIELKRKFGEVIHKFYMQQQEDENKIAETRQKELAKFGDFIQKFYNEQAKQVNALQDKQEKDLAKREAAKDKPSRTAAGMATGGKFLTGKTVESEWMTNLKSIADGTKSIIGTLFTDLMHGGQNFFGNMISGFTSMFQNIAVQFLQSQAMRGLSGLFGGTGGIAGGTFGLGNLGVGIPAFASGGRYMAGMPRLVGENGPELDIPNHSGTIVPGGAMGGVNVTMNIHTPDAGSFGASRSQIVADLGQQIQSVLKRNR